MSAWADRKKEELVVGRRITGAAWLLALGFGLASLALPGATASAQMMTTPTSKPSMAVVPRVVVPPRVTTPKVTTPKITTPKITTPARVATPTIPTRVTPTTRPGPKVTPGFSPPKYVPPKVATPGQPTGPRPGSYPPRGPRVPPVIVGIPPALGIPPYNPPPPVDMLDDDDFDGPPPPPPPGRGRDNVGGPPPSSRQTAQPSGPTGPNGLPPAGERRYLPDELVIEIAGTITDRQVEAITRQHRLTRLASQRFTSLNTTLFRWRINDRRTVSQVITQLQRDRRITSVQPNYQFILQDDQLAKTMSNVQADAPRAYGDPLQYALAKLQLPQAHRLATGEKVLVAVIDSGIDQNHPELAGVIANRFDTLEGEFVAGPHGTAMAGAIAARAKLMGVAPRVELLAVRAFGGSKGVAEGTSFAIYRGLDWAIAAGARVINMSFAGPPDPMLARLLAAAHKKGIVLIAAAGNAGPKSPPLYPAADPSVIAVTATDAEDKLFSAANRGRHIAVAAPGVDILVPAPDGRYEVTSGTSVAAAQISGIAALLLERNPRLEPVTLRRILMSTAKDLGPRGKDEEFGAGLADAYEAVMASAPASADKAAETAR